MTNGRVARAPHSGVPSEAHAAALARIYSRAIERYQQEMQTAERPTSEPKATARVKRKEEVNHVDQPTQ